MSRRDVWQALELTDPRGTCTGAELSATLERVRTLRRRQLARITRELRDTDPVVPAELPRELAAARYVAEYAVQAAFLARHVRHDIATTRRVLNRSRRVLRAARPGSSLDTLRRAAGLVRCSRSRR